MIPENEMVSEEEYKKACEMQKLANEIMKVYHSQTVEKFEKRMATNPIFKDEELYYSASALCPCGHGLAYPKDCGFQHYWDCSAILKGESDNSVTHIAKLPFTMYSIKGESEVNGSTRGVFKPYAEKKVQ